MRASDIDIQTPDEREEALKNLAEHVFFQFMNAVLNKPSRTFKGMTPIEYARQGVDEFRKIEKLWLPYERPDEEFAL